MRFVSPSLIVFLSVVAVVPTGASTALPEPGTRIRLTARLPRATRWAGSFVSFARDTVTLRDPTNGALVTVPTLHIERFEVSLGTRRNSLRGAKVGLPIGMVLGAGFGYAFTDEGTNYAFGSSRTRSAGVGAAVVGAIGAAVGALVGTLIHSEHWRALPPEDLRGTVRP